MYCRNCGNKLPEGARFCGACGAEQKQSMVNADEKQPEKEKSKMAVSSYFFRSCNISRNSHVICWEKSR